MPKLNRQRHINLANQAQAQLATTKREAAGDAPSSQRHKQFDVDDTDHPLNAWFTSNFDERVELLNTNNDICNELSRPHAIRCTRRPNDIDTEAHGHTAAPGPVEASSLGVMLTESRKDIIKRTREEAVV